MMLIFKDIKKTSNLSSFEMINNEIVRIEFSIHIEVLQTPLILCYVHFAKFLHFLAEIGRISKLHAKSSSPLTMLKIFRLKNVLCQVYQNTNATDDFYRHEYSEVPPPFITI